MAASFLFPCPHCHQSVALSTVQAGQELNCTHCEQPITAPKLGELKRLPPANAATATDHSSDNSSLGSKNSGRSNLATDSQLKRTLLASGLAIALIAGAAGAGIYYWATSRLIEEVDWDGHFAEVNQQIEEMSPAQLLASWSQSIPEDGLPDWQEPPLIRYRVQGQYLQTIDYGLWGLAIAGLLMMASTRFIKRP